MSDRNERACPSCGSYLHHDCCVLEHDGHNIVHASPFPAESIRAMMLAEVERQKAAKAEAIASADPCADYEAVAKALDATYLDGHPHPISTVLGKIDYLRSAAEERDAVVRQFSRMKRDMHAALSAAGLSPAGSTEALRELIEDVEHCLDEGLKREHVDDLREAVAEAKRALP